MSALTDRLLRGSDGWPTLAVGLTFALIGLMDLLDDDASNSLSAGAHLAFALALLAMYGGARLGSRAVQQVGLVVAVGALFLLIGDLFGLV